MVSVSSLMISDVSADEALAPIKPARKSAHAHHLGHRERLRARAKAGGLVALPDYELLELFLFRTIPRGDVKPLAKRLLTRFGSFGGVLGASIEELCTVSGIGEAAAMDIKLLHEATLERPARLCPRGPGQRVARAVPRLVSRQEEPADRRRGDEPRHGRPRPGLSARGDAASAGAVVQQYHPGAQPSHSRFFGHAHPHTTTLILLHILLFRAVRIRHAEAVKKG